MEKACTEHLKQIGAYLAPDEFDEVDFRTEDFPCEATVVIPVRNRVRTIEDAIRSVLSPRNRFRFQPYRGGQSFHRRNDGSHRTLCHP